MTGPSESRMRRLFVAVSRLLSSALSKPDPEEPPSIEEASQPSGLGEIVQLAKPVSRKDQE